jgi:hypothetical protein
VLLARSVLWTLGTGRLALVDRVFRVHTLIMAGLCACTVYRAWRYWTPTSGTALPVAGDAHAPIKNERPASTRQRLAKGPIGTAR